MTKLRMIQLMAWDSTYILCHEELEQLAKCSYKPNVERIFNAYKEDRRFADYYLRELYRTWSRKEG